MFISSHCYCPLTSRQLEQYLDYNAFSVVGLAAPDTLLRRSILKSVGELRKAAHGLNDLNPWPRDHQDP